MGSWVTGAFDNDGAADFLDGLDDAEPGEREDAIRAAFETATQADEYLDVDEGQDAIAAAAVVAAIHQGRPVTAFGDDRTFAATEYPPATPELRALAVAALNRVTGDDSEWRELWEETDDYAAALATIDELRAALT